VNVRAKDIKVPSPVAQPEKKNPAPVGFQGHGYAHNNSAQVSSFLNPVNGIRDLQKRQGIVPRDHSRNNRIAIKQASAKNHEKKLSSEVVRQHHPVGQVPVTNRPRPTSTRGPAGPASPSPNSENRRNFVQENLAEAVSKKNVREPKKELPKISDGPSKQKHSDYGKVPVYLQDRKQEMDDMACYERAMAARADIPEGMKLLSEDERQSTVKQLNDTKAQIEDDLRRLPFNIETPSQIKHKSGLEGRLHEVEEAIKVFSRKKVYVRDS